MRTFGDLSYKNGNWVFANIEPHCMIKLKAIFPKIAKGQTCPFSMRHSPEFAVDLSWFIDRYPLKLSDTDSKFLRKDRDEHIEKLSALEVLFKPDYQPREFILKKPLRNYQTLAVELYLSVKRLVVGDVVGLGKTLVAIGSFCEPKTLPAAVIVQTHLPKQWLERITEFSDLKVHIVRNGPVYQLPPSDVYIFKYTQLAKWVDVLVSGVVRSIVFDEIQELRHSESHKYQAAYAISNAVDYVLGLSATPIYNYGDEIFNILNLVKEGCLGNRWDFLREWTNGNDHIVTDPKALGSYLRENHLFLRRTRKEVGQELPPVNRIVETVDYDQEAIEQIEDLARTLAIKVISGSFVERGQASRDLDIMVRQATGISKAKYVAQYVRMIVEAGEPVLLAGWHREVYRIWERELQDLKPVWYTGTESPKQKEESKHKFISGESDLMIISLRSGVGLDGLQERASIVVIGELDWSPEIHEQVCGRLNRDGQKNQVSLIFCVSDSGSDPGIIQTLGIKSSQSSGIIDPFSEIEITHSDPDRIKRLAETFLHRRAKKSGQGELALAT